MTVALGPDHPHPHLSDQPGDRVPGVRETGEGDPAIRGRRQTDDRGARPRPPAHSRQSRQPGGVLPNHGKTDRALPLLEEAAKRRTAVLGPDHPDTLYSLVILALGYQDAGSWTKRSRCSRTSSSGGPRYSVPTTRTHSPASTTWRRATG